MSGELGGKVKANKENTSLVKFLEESLKQKIDNAFFSTFRFSVYNQSFFLF